MPEAADHKRFTVAATAYLLNLNREEMQSPAYAVHYQDPPRPSETGGEIISLRFPTLIVAAYVSDPQAVAEKVAGILNRHWDDGQPLPPLAEARRAIMARRWTAAEADELAALIKIGDLPASQKRMLFASAPDDVTGTEGLGVELRTGADYAVAKALTRRRLGQHDGPGGSLPGMYWSNSEGLALRKILMERDAAQAPEVVRG